jgi:predicted GIY-YIG superfamily endonuclease/ADP-ribose pyrophosphatase YjhB (NUDIX family)
MWFVYILLCRGGSLYTGTAKDPAKRFREHAIGRGGAYTRSHKPIRLLHVEPAPSYAAALKREHEIKTWKRSKKLGMLGVGAEEKTFVRSQKKQAIIRAVTSKCFSPYVYCPSCATPLQRKLIDHTERVACPNCPFVFWNNPKPTTSIILAKNHKVLLLKRGHKPFLGYWVLPGGYVEYNENPESTIVRETKEETGLDVMVNGITWVYLIDTDPRGNSVDIVFEGTTIGGRVELREEHVCYDFFSPHRLPEQIAYKHREAIGIWSSKQ